MFDDFGSIGSEYISEKIEKHFALDRWEKK